MTPIPYFSNTSPKCELRAAELPVRKMSTFECLEILIGTQKIPQWFGEFIGCDVTVSGKKVSQGNSDSFPKRRDMDVISQLPIVPLHGRSEKPMAGNSR